MTPMSAAAPASADVGPETGVDSPETPTAWPRWEALLSVGMVVAVVLLLAWGAWRGLRDGEWTPVLDIAAMEIRVHAIPETWPLVGVFSRLGWYHPGPLFILQGWLPYQLWGPTGLGITIVAVHLASLVTAWWVARRIDRLAGSFVLLTAVILLATRSAEQTLEPWNPFAGLVGTVALLVLGWAAAQRRPVGPIIMLPLATYLLQSHLGYAPLVGLVVLTAAALALWSGRDRTRNVAWVSWLTGAVIAVLLWVPVIVQQVTGEPGNISAIVSAFGDSGEPLGAGAAVAVLSSAFALRPYWTQGLQVSLPEDASTPWWLLLTMVALAWAIARSDWLAVRVLVICAAGIAAGFAAVTTASGLPAEYLVSWIPAVAATTIAMSAWTLQRGIGPLRDGVGGAYLSVAVSLASAVLAAVTAWHWTSASQTLTGHGQATTALADSLLADAGQTPFNLGADPGTSVFSAMDVRTVFYGLLAAAVRAEVEVGAPVPIVWEVADVVPSDLQPRRTYVVRNVDPARDDGARVVARWDPLSPAETAELLALDATIAATSDIGQSEALKARRLQLLDGRVALELVEVPSGMVGQS